MSFQPSLPGFLKLNRPAAAQFLQRERWAWVLLASGLGLGVLAAYLITAGLWHIALGLILTVPGIVLLQKQPFLSVLVWLILAPFLMTTETTVERSIYWVIHRALPPITIGIVLLGRAFKLNRRQSLRLGWVELAMASYLIVSVLSVITVSGSPLATAFRLYDRVFIPMCLYLLVRLSAPTEHDLRWLMPVLFFLGVSQSIIGLLSWFAPSVLPTAWLEMAGTRTTGSLINPTYYSLALVFAGLMLLHAALHRPPGLIRWLYLSAFVLTLLLDFLSMSRANWLGAIFIIMGLLWLYPRLMIKLGLVVMPVTLFIGGTLFASQIEWAGQRLNSQESAQTAIDRLPAYLAAYHMFEARPVFGWGYENFDRFDRRFQGQVGNYESDNKDHTAHNLYLITLAEQGLLGLTLYLAPLIGLLIRSLKALRRNSGVASGSRQLLIVLWLSILNYFVLANFMNMLVVFGLGVYWLTLGLIAHLADARFIHGERVADERSRENGWKTSFARQTEFGPRPSMHKTLRSLR